MGFLKALRQLTVLLLAVLPWACTPEAPERPAASHPLFADLRPDVLTEADRLALPPATESNRFLGGWVPWREDGELRLTTSETGARIELVHLEARPRRLVLDLAADLPPAGSLLHVTTPGGELPPIPVTDPLELELPAELLGGRIGRIPLGLRLEAPSKAPAEQAAAAALTVRDSRISPALPSAEAEWTESSLTQAGPSRVAVALPVHGGEALHGRLRWPRDATSEQRFRILIEREGRPWSVYEHRPSWLAQRLGWTETTFRLPLTDEGGAGETETRSETRWVRVVFEALGAGPAIRWSELRIEGPKATSIPAPARVTRAAGAAQGPPRLVLVYVMDALRADEVGYLGGRPGISPTFDRLAAEGAAFFDHRTPAPKTRPSTWALFTGQPFHAGDDVPTLAELFRDAGYRTALFSGNPNVSPAFGHDRGFDHVAEEVLFPAYGRGEERPVNDNAAEVHRAALAWLEDLKDGERAFLYLHTIHPHSPYTPPEPFRSRYTRGIPSAVTGYSETLFDVKQGRLETDDDDRRRLRGLYGGAFSYNDHELASFLGEVQRCLAPAGSSAEADGDLDGGLFLALTSDHGEEFFDHGGVLHGHTLYREQLHVPLVLWSPGRLAAQEIHAPTHTLDLYASLLDEIGVAPPRPTPGRSFFGSPKKDLSPGKDPGPRVRFATESYYRPLMLSAESRRWKVVWAPRTGRHWGMGEGIGRDHDPEVLFDLESDPWEHVNRAGHGDLEAEWLRARLLGWLDALRARPQAGREPEADLDEETRSRLRALGYAE